MRLTAVRELSVPISVLELAMVRKGTTAREALRATAVVAGHIERLGYRRLRSHELVAACLAPA